MQRTQDEVARDINEGQQREQGFMLRGPGASLTAEGVKRRLSNGTARDLEARLQTFFAEGAKLVVGAIPFRSDAPDACYEPERILWGAGRGRPGHPVGKLLRLTPVPTAAGYAQIVKEALERIRVSEGRLRKVVLARSLTLEIFPAVDEARILEQLASDASVTTFCVGISGKRRLMGATPELLVSRKGRKIASYPLAGSARRSRDGAADALAARTLLQSEKDRREHRYVVEAILDLLAPFCSQLDTPRGMAARSTATMWHLGTEIEGTLKGEGAPSAAGLAALLHPTPAVGGDPRGLAVEAIRALEKHDRGFYSGAVGYVDAVGDGEWYVALRCAEIQGSQVTLYAGAGIVAGSDPELEVTETSAKFLLLDEPVSALDLHYQLHVMKLVRSLAEERKMIIVMVLHELATAARWSDRVIVLSGGKIAADGEPSAAISSKVLADVYKVSGRVTKENGRLVVDIDDTLTLEPLVNA